MESTLPETNIAPENGWLEYYFPIGEAYFQGRLLLVSGRVFLKCVIRSYKIKGVCELRKHGFCPFLFPLQDFKDYSDCITMGGAKGKGKADGDGWIHTGDDVNDHGNLRGPPQCHTPPKK